MKESELVTLQELQYAIKNVGSFDLGDFSFDTIQHILNMYSQLEKENTELKRMLQRRIKYTQELEQDLFENCSNYVVPKSVIIEKIEELEEEKLCFYSDYAIEERNNKIELLKELLGEE